MQVVLRQDPDIVMIGEIRDAETAEIAVRAAITGHLVLSTLHTNDAPSSIGRLVDMGIKPYLLSTSIVGIMAQRLVRKVCDKCKIEYEANEYEKKLLNYPIEKSLKLYKKCGCGYCNDIGYSGRIGIYEIMEVTREIRNAINMGANSDEIKDIAIKNGMRTLSMQCKKLVLDGITTIDELLTITSIGDLE